MDFFFRLRDVILTDARLYLIFEYLEMDLKKYFDCLGDHRDMDVALIRVNQLRTSASSNQFYLCFLELLIPNSERFTFLSLPSNYSSGFKVDRNGSVDSNCLLSIRF